jgi:hypothetical protein
MNEIEIDKDIPIPVRNGNHGPKYAHVVRKLEVGDSFWIAKDKVGSGFPASIRNLSRALQIRTTTRTEEKDNVEGWRVWRVKNDTTPATSGE